MSKFLRMALLAGLGVLAITSAASAVVPDPTVSSCGACLVIAPGGEYSFSVTVKDQFNNAINNSNVTVDFGSCPNVHVCAGQDAGFLPAGQTVSGHTAISGSVTFTIHGGGACNPGPIKIYADGVQICSLSRSHSPDFDHNATTTIGLADVGIFAADQSANNLDADFNCSGSVNLPDVGLFAGSQALHSSDGAHCPLIHRRLVPGQSDRELDSENVPRGEHNLGRHEATVMHQGGGDRRNYGNVRTG